MGKDTGQLVVEKVKNTDTSFSITFYSEPTITRVYGCFFPIVCSFPAWESNTNETRVSVRDSIWNTISCKIDTIEDVILSQLGISESVDANLGFGLFQGLVLITSGILEFSSTVECELGKSRLDLRNAWWHCRCSSW